MESKEQQQTPQNHEFQQGSNPNNQNSFLFSERHTEAEISELHDNKQGNQLVIDSPGSQVLNKDKSIQPNFVFQVTLTVQPSAIQELFLQVSLENGYAPIENEKNNIMVIQQNKVTLKTYLLSCMLGRIDEDEVISAVKLHITTNTNTCTRKVTIKGLKGNSQDNHKLVACFKEALEKKKKELNPVQANSTDQGEFHLDGAFVQQNLQQDDDDDEEVQYQNNPFTLESTANYMFNKILSQTSYGIGSKTHQYIDQFEEKYQELLNQKEPDQIKPYMLSKPMKDCGQLINEIVESLFSDHNYGKQETKRIMPYCKISVEKYLFSKIDKPFNQIYQNKYGQKDEKFMVQRQKILEKYSIKQIMKESDAHTKFWLLKNISERGNYKNEVLYHENDPKYQDIVDKQDQPYYNAILELKKIESAQSPREKLKCVQMMKSALRSCVIDFHEGKEEVVSMDDELPIIIYIVLMSGIKNIHSIMYMIEDFINQDPSLEIEKRSIINVYASASFITDEYKV